MTQWPGEPQMDYDVLVADSAAASAAGKPITDVIFDFGNVLIRWDPTAALVSRYDEDTVRRFLDNEVSGFFDAADMMDGGMSITDAVAWVRAKYGDAWADMLSFYCEHFEDSLMGLVPGARMLVRDLRQAGIGVWGLSNWERELFALAVRDCPLLQELDGRLVSGFVGLRKPHKDIYERALADFGIDASTSVFVDDKAMNIVGANEAGIRGVRFSDPRALRHLLVEAGVPIPDVVRL